MAQLRLSIHALTLAIQALGSQSTPASGQQPVQESKRLLTMQDVLDLTSVSPKTLRRQIVRGNLPTIRVGNRLRFRPADVEDWLDCEIHNYRKVVKRRSRTSASLGETE